MPEETEVEKSGVRQVYTQQGMVAAIMEAAKRWGVYATVMAVLIGCLIGLAYYLLKRQESTDVWIRDKLTGIVERDIESRRDTREALEDFTKTADDLSDAIEDFTKTQKENK